MNESKTPIAGYLIAAAVGGVAVAIFTRAIPAMMSNMMGNMMKQMGNEGCNPEEMWRQMMQGFGEAQSESA